MATSTFHQAPNLRCKCGQAPLLEVDETRDYGDSVFYVAVCHNTGCDHYSLVQGVLVPKLEQV